MKVKFKFRFVCYISFEYILDLTNPSNLSCFVISPNITRNLSELKCQVCLWRNFVGRIYESYGCFDIWELFGFEARWHSYVCTSLNERVAAQARRKWEHKIFGWCQVRTHYYYFAIFIFATWLPTSGAFTTVFCPHNTKIFSV